MVVPDYLVPQEDGYGGKIEKRSSSMQSYGTKATDLEVENSCVYTFLLDVCKTNLTLSASALALNTKFATCSSCSG